MPFGFRNVRRDRYYEQKGETDCKINKDKDRSGKLELVIDQLTVWHNDGLMPDW